MKNIHYVCLLKTIGKVCPRFDLQFTWFLKKILFNLTISFNLTQIKSFSKFCDNISSICSNSSFFIESSRDLKAPNCSAICFSKAFPKEKYENVACSIICLWLEGNIPSPVRY